MMMIPDSGLLFGPPCTIKRTPLYGYVLNIGPTNGLSLCGRVIGHLPTENSDNNHALATC